MLAILAQASPAGEADSFPYGHAFILDNFIGSVTIALC